MNDRNDRGGRREFLRIAGAGIGVGVGASLVTGRSAAQSVGWQQTYGPADYTNAEDAVETTDGGFAVTATSWNISSDVVAFWLAKVNPDGGIEWDRIYDFDAYNESRELVQLADGSFVVAGDTFGSSSDGGVNRLVRTAADGTLLGSRTFGEATVARLEEMVEVRCDGETRGVAVLGSRFSPETGRSFWLLRTDASLRPLWERTYADLSGVGVDLVRPSAGGYAVAGSGATESGTLAAWLGRFDDDGDLRWERTYDTASGADALVERCDGGETQGYALSGATDDRVWTIETDPDGAVVQDETYEQSASVADLAAGGDGYAVLGAVSQGSGDSYDDPSNFWLLKTDDRLRASWSATYGSEFADGSWTTDDPVSVVTTDRGYVLTGTSFEVDDPVYRDVWAVNVVPD